MSSFYFILFISLNYITFLLNILPSPFGKIVSILLLFQIHGMMSSSMSVLINTARGKMAFSLIFRMFFQAVFGSQAYIGAAGKMDAGTIKLTHLFQNLSVRRALFHPAAFSFR